MKEATREEWKALYEAVLASRAQEPWRLFRDEQLFAIEVQEFGETAYCSIIGYYEQPVKITI